MSHAANRWGAVIFAALTLFSTPALAATFEAVLAPNHEPMMGILVRGQIEAGDAGRLDAQIAATTNRFADHRMRAIGLDSPGGLVSEAMGMATTIRRLGLVTVIPDRAKCVSACVLLFAAGSTKVASPNAFVGVHGASEGGEQTDTAVVATADIAKIYAQFGVPASVIGRMVVTDPEDMAWLSGDEISMFPCAVVQQTDVTIFPIMMAGYDGSSFCYGTTKRVPPYQQTGLAQPTPRPPSPDVLTTPAHTGDLVRIAKRFAEGYLYGISKDDAECNKSGDWNRGCLGGNEMRFKPYMRKNGVFDSSGAPEPHLPTQEQLWLAAYDSAYVSKSSEGDCGNISAPANDGCRAGARSWLRTETTSPVTLESSDGTSASERAQPVSAQPSFDCGSASTTLERLICGDSLLAAWDGEMGRRYQMALRTASPADRADITARQRAWGRSRIERCNIPSSGGLPAEAKKDAEFCLLNMTTTRVAELH